MQEEIKTFREEWTAKVAHLRDQRREIDEQILFYENRLAALDVVQASAHSNAAGAQPRSEDPHSAYIGPEIVEWAREYLERNGAANVKTLYCEMPSELRRKFEFGRSSQPPLFRFRRLFRRASHIFSVRRSDGLVELVAPTKTVDHGWVIISIVQPKDARKQFIVTAEGGSKSMSLDDLRDAVAAGESFYVPGRDGVLSSVVLRSGFLRSAGSDGALNNDLACLPVIEFPDEVTT